MPSPGASLTCNIAVSKVCVASASAPGQISAVPELLSYDTSTSITIGWSDPPYSGGFSVLVFNVYVDNSLWGTPLDASKNTLQITGLTLGTHYKI